MPLAIKTFLVAVTAGLIPTTLIASDGIRFEGGPAVQDSERSSNFPAWLRETESKPASPMLMPAGSRSRTYRPTDVPTPRTIAPPKRTTVRVRRPVMQPASMIRNQPIRQPVAQPTASHHDTGMRVDLPHTGTSASCGACAVGGPCVDRNGDGLLDETNHFLGMGPCPNDTCNCWQCPHTMPFNLYGPGEYAGPARTQRVPEYRLRAGDAVELMFLITGMKSQGPYRLVVGDQLLIESESDQDIKRGTFERGLMIQPDGTITLRLIGTVYAAGQTLDQLREVLNEKYKDYYDEPNIDVTPINTGTAAQYIRQAISGTAGFDPQRIDQTVSPSGELRLPRIGSVYAQGLTIEELKREINLRYDAEVGGLEVEPSLLRQAPHYVYVLGEVRQPGRFNLDETPTTLLGAVAMAGGHIPGANLRQVVVFRRGENFELLSTMLDVRGAILGRESNPADEIWLRDGDVIILPSTPIRLINNLVRQVFTEGIYGIVPLSASYNFGESF